MQRLRLQPRPLAGHRRAVLAALAACTACAVGLGLPRLAQAAEPVPVLIGHPSVPRLEAAVVARLYTGRAIEVAGVAVTVANAAPGSALRQRFLATWLQQDDDKYRAYWTVRRHVGKGAPPRDMGSSAEMIDWVQATPGAIGYVDAADLRPGLHVLARP